MTSRACTASRRPRDYGSNSEGISSVRALDLKLLSILAVLAGCFAEAPAGGPTVGESSTSDEGGSATTSGGVPTTSTTSPDPSDTTAGSSDADSSGGALDSSMSTTETGDLPVVCDYHVFVTSQEWQAQALGGLDGARERCHGAAPFDGDWQAVLSTMDSVPPGAAGVVCDLDENVIADDERPWWGDQGHRLPISLTENGSLGATSNPLVWTATTFSGSYNNLGGDCGQWGGYPIVAGESAGVGDATESSSAWVSHATSQCTATARLYCIARSR
jgi:hypothetical protein